MTSAHQICSAPPSAGSPRRSSPRRPCDAVIRLVCAARDLRLADLRSRKRRSSTVAFARQVAMYLAHVSLGMTHENVGRAFGRDRTTVAHACRVVEDRRDDPAVDAWLAPLERSCRLALEDMREAR